MCDIPSGALPALQPIPCDEETFNVMVGGWYVGPSLYNTPTK